MGEFFHKFVFRQCSFNRIVLLFNCNHYEEIITILNIIKDFGVLISAAVMMCGCIFENYGRVRHCDF